MPQFESTRLTEYSRESLIREIQRVAALIPQQIITLRAFDRLGRVRSTSLRTHFGGWKEALSAAGLGHRTGTAPIVDSEAMLAELGRVSQLLRSENLSSRDFNRHSQLCRAQAIMRRFGTWLAALQKAGLTPVPNSKRYADGECFENLLRLWIHSGRQPVYREIKVPPSTVGPSAYIRRWGSWTRAVHAFVDAVEGDAISDSDESQADTPIAPSAPIPDAGGLREMQSWQRKSVPVLNPGTQHCNG